MADPTFRSKVLADGGGVGVSSLTPTEPAGATTDDILIYWIWINAPTASTFAMTSGVWTQFYGPQSDGTSEVYGLWTRRGGSAPNYQSTWTTSSAAECSVSCWAGCETSGNPYDQLATAAVSSANPCNPNPPSVTTTVGTIVTVFGVGLAGTRVAPTGYTLRDGNGANWNRVCAASKDLPSAGAEDPAAFTGGDTNLRSIWAATMALKAPGGATTRPVKMAGEWSGYAGTGGGFAG